MNYSFIWYVVIIFIILTHIMQFNWFINLQTVMKLYLYQESVRYQVLNTLYQLKLIAFYITLQWWMKTLIIEAERRVQVINQVFNDIFTYNNLEFTESKCEWMINEFSDQSHSVSLFLIVSSIMNSWNNICDISVAVYCHQQRLSSIYCLKTWITKYILLQVDFQTAELIILLFQICFHHIKFIIQALYILNVLLSDDIQYFWITAMLTL